VLHVRQIRANELNLEQPYSLTKMTTAAPMRTLHAATLKSSSGALKTAERGLTLEILGQPAPLMTGSGQRPRSRSSHRTSGQFNGPKIVGVGSVFVLNLKRVDQCFCWRSICPLVTGVADSALSRPSRLCGEPHGRAWLPEFADQWSHLHRHNFVEAGAPRGSGMDFSSLRSARFRGAASVS